MVPASSSRHRSAALARAATVVAAVAVAALVAVAAQVAPAAAAADPLADAVAAVVPDPSPSLRGVGNTLYTTLKSNATTSVFGARNGTSIIKGALSSSLQLEGERERERQGEGV
jgi:DMSO/TMAO reductase YedYZ molybdopterin-dependent catalytic subunit